jgi:hypothetical protein
VQARTHQPLKVFTDFGFSRWLIIDVDFVLGLLHRVDVSDAADVSKVHAASIFRVEVCRLMSLCSIYRMKHLRTSSP